MNTTEVLAPGIAEAMPDAQLVLRMQQLRIDVASIKDQITRGRENPYGRAPDWTVRAEGRLKDKEAALQQVREEGRLRLEAARGKAA